MNQADPSWDLYRSFLAVLQTSSLSGAARLLALTQPTLARHIGELEEALGFELFVRSPRGLSPTDAALALRPHAEALASAAGALVRAASGVGKAIAGTVRVTASEVMAAEALPPILAALRAEHPALEIELVASNTVEDLLRRDADIAVRTATPEQEALWVKRLGTITLGLHAHRRYLDQRGVPRRLEDLHDHSVVGYDRVTPAIRGMLAKVPGFERVRFALRVDNDLAQLAAIRAGFGLGVCQVAVARRDPQLVRVLPTVVDLKIGTWLVMHENLRTTPRCRVVFEGLARGLRGHLDAAGRA
jgi:DNA-binding transcriptional LysR family regulator